METVADKNVEAGAVPKKRSRKRNRNAYQEKENAYYSGTKWSSANCRDWGKSPDFLVKRAKKRVTFQDEKAPDGDARLLEEGELAASPEPPAEVEKPPPTMPRYQYSRQQLMQIRSSPLAQKRPDCLDASFNSCLKMPVTSNSSRGVWDPERWHLDRKRSDTPPDEVASGNPPGESHKRRPGDPRERIRKEQDGIVLSPQRRSFNSGCFVTQTQSQPPPLVRRPESPIGKSDRDRDPSHREIQSRRIGSGRILARERDGWDLRHDKTADPPQPDFNSFQRGANPSREREADRFERRSFGRDFGASDKERNRGGNRGYGRRFESREEEPEWFSAGPTSQHDTIELRGFDDVDDHQARPPTKKQAAAIKAAAKNITRGGAAQKPDVSTTTSSPPTKPVSPVKPPSPISASLPVKVPSPSHAKTDEEQLAADYNFLDDFLKGDVLPNMLSNGAEAEGTGSSRFKRYFHHESPPNRPDSRRASQNEMLNNLFNDFAEAPRIDVSTLGNSETYFAPISPAASSSAAQPPPPPPSKKTIAPSEFLELLQRGQGDGSKFQSQANSLASSKIPHVEELEARMRQQGIATQSKALATKAMPPKKSDEDLNAFQKLLSQVSSRPVATNGGSMHQPQAISLREMLNKVQSGDCHSGSSQPVCSEQQALNLLASVNKSQPPQLQQPAASNVQIPQDLVMKLLHVQQQQHRQQQAQDMLNKLVANQQHKTRLTPAGAGYQQSQPSLSPLPMDASAMMHQASRELMQRPEAQAIIQGLKHGEITSQHLVQQLQNPAMQPRHRELLANILKHHAPARAPSPHLAPPQQPQQQPDMLQQMLLQQQNQQHNQQQLRIPSPLPNGLPHRVPSPRELIVHTQNIMQSALIKKKLEEQRENFRKRQSVQQSVSPSGAEQQPIKLVASPTPLAFTPTSVMRKMTADKDPEQPMAMPVPRAELKLQLQQPAFSLASVIQQQQQPPTVQHRTQPPLPMMAQLGRAQQTLQLQQQQQAQQQAQQSASNWIPPSAKLPGRPIVKGNANFQQFSASMDFSAPQQPLQPPLRSMHVGYPNTASRNKMPAQQQQPAMNPLMMMYRPQMNQPAGRGSSQKLPGQMQQQPNMMPTTLQQMLQQQTYANAQRGNVNEASMRHQSQPMPMRQAQGMNMHGGGDISTSPTSNQLAQWFSPELLAQAKAGRLAGMPAISTMPNILSLEELERLQQGSTTVHN